MRGYLRSPYASQFADAFVAGVVTLNATIDRQAVVDIAAMMEPEQEKVIYLRIARRAAIDGLIDFAAFAAAHAEGVENDPRAELYSSLSIGHVGHRQGRARQACRRSTAAGCPRATASFSTPQAPSPPK